MNLLLLFSFFYVVHATNTLIIFLGCAIPEILEDRISTTVNYANLIQNDNTTFFLSGGNKDPASLDATEASRLYTKMNSRKHYANQWTYILDEESTNTAENLIRAERFISNNGYNFDTIYVATSRFHYKRTKTFVEHIFPSDINISWILAPYETRDLVYWETVHIRNVHSDVATALKKI